MARSKSEEVRRRSVAPGRAFDLKLNGIHLTHVILKFWDVYE